MIADSARVTVGHRQMETMDTLRWILLGVGVLVIAGLFAYYKWQESGVRKPQRRAPRSGRGSHRDRDVEAALKDMDDFVLGDDDGVDTSASAPSLDTASEGVGPVRVRKVADSDSDTDRQAGTESATPAEIGAAEPGAEAAAAEPATVTRSHVDDRPGAGADVTPEPEPHVESSAQPESSGQSTEPGARGVEEAPAASGADRGWRLGPMRFPRPGRGSEEPSDQGGGTSEQAQREAVSAAVGDKIVVLHVHAGEGFCFTAPAVQEAINVLGVQFGQHRICHHLVTTELGEEPMYSVASMVKPGTLDPSDATTLETPGLALFMQLPGPCDGLSAFDQMLEAARRLADRLEGELLDGHRCHLTNQTVEHLREELREYRRQSQLALRRQAT